MGTSWHGTTLLGYELTGRQRYSTVLVHSVRVPVLYHMPNIRSSLRVRLTNCCLHEVYLYLNSA